MVFVIGPLVIGQVVNRMIANPHAFTDSEQEWLKRKLEEIDRQTEQPTPRPIPDGTNEAPDETTPRRRTTT